MTANVPNQTPREQVERVRMRIAERTPAYMLAGTDPCFQQNWFDILRVLDALLASGALDGRAEAPADPPAVCTRCGLADPHNDGDTCVYCGGRREPTTEGGGAGTYDSSDDAGQSYTFPGLVVPVSGVIPKGTRVRVVPIEEKT